MNGNHKIRTLKVYTGFDSEALAMERRTALTAFARERLPRIVDEVFSRRSGPGIIQRFDRVEFNLGVFSGDEFSDGIEQRLRKKLEDFLDDHPVLPEPVSSAASHGQIDSGPAEEEAILHFLEKGILPWYGSFSNAGDMAASLEKCLGAGAARFINRFKDVPDMKIAVKRLTRQFPDASVERMLETIAPGRGRSTREAIRRLGACYSTGAGEKIGKDPCSGPGTFQEIKSRVWEHMLLISLGGRGILANPLQLELPLHFPPKVREEISRILRTLPGSNAVVSAVTPPDGPDNRAFHPSFWAEKILAALENPGKRAGHVADPDIPRIWGDVMLRCFDFLADHIQVNACGTALKNTICIDGSDTGITGRSMGNIAGTRPGDSRDGNLGSGAGSHWVKIETIGNRTYLLWIQSLLACLGTVADEDMPSSSVSPAGAVLPVIRDMIQQAAAATENPDMFLAELSFMVAGQLTGKKGSSIQKGRMSVKQLSGQFFSRMASWQANAHVKERPGVPVSAAGRSLPGAAPENFHKATLWQIILSETWIRILTSGVFPGVSGSAGTSDKNPFSFSVMEGMLSLAPEKRELFSIRALFGLAERMQLPIAAFPDPGIGTDPGQWSQLLGNPAVQNKQISSLNLEEIWEVIQAILQWKIRKSDIETVRAIFGPDACYPTQKTLDDTQDDGQNRLADKLSRILNHGPDSKDFLSRVLTGLISGDLYREHDLEDKPKSSVPQSQKSGDPWTERHLEAANNLPPALKPSADQDATQAAIYPAMTCREWNRASEPVFVENAGIVLCGPYLPMLFRKLGLLDDRQFKSLYAAEKAVHILQYLVTGEPSAPEYRLMLNKLLCGMDPARPIHPLLGLEKWEKNLTRELILSMIAHWKVLGKTSVEGFRESFLVREGRLAATEDAWTLVVAPKPFDMLLDRIPWTFSPMRLPWMEQGLHVRWR